MADDVVTAADIARLAGVGRAAVSNWRSRHDDFPRQVGGSPASPLYSRAEVEAWLAARGRTLDGERRVESRSQSADLANVVVSLLPADPPGVVLDPACGAGTVLAAAGRRFGPQTSYLGQDTDRDQVVEARRALTEAGVSANGLHTGSPLVDDALARFRGAADAVVCLPPAKAPWSADETGLEAPWEFGTPSQLDPYLAWLQLCYGYLKPGGCAVVLVTSAVAVRASGRRIRMELLRAGALRRVVALPDRFGMAGSWQLWVLVRPVGRPPYTVTMVDLTGLSREEVPTDEAAWRKVSRDPALCREVEGIELLDDDVLLLPSRHVEAPVRDVGPEYDRLRAELTKAAAALEVRLPALPRGKGEAPRTLISVLELVKLGAVSLVDKGGQVRPGDVVVPTGADRFDAAVVGEDGQPHTTGEVLRCDPDLLDPYFLACFLRSESNRRSASGTLGGTSRLDLRRARIPRLPLAEQRPFGAAFRALTEATDRLDRLNALAADAVQKAVYGLTSGVLAPPRVTRTRAEGRS